MFYIYLYYSIHTNVRYACGGLRVGGLGGCTDGAGLEEDGSGWLISLVCTWCIPVTVLIMTLELDEGSACILASLLSAKITKK